MIDWQPFDTAPRDGTEILSYTIREPYSRDKISIISWHDDVRNRSSKMDWFDQYNYPLFDDPDYWAYINIPEKENNK